MNDAAVLRRLRLGGAVAVGALIAVALVQAILLLLPSLVTFDNLERRLAGSLALVGSGLVLATAIWLHLLILQPGSRYARIALRKAALRRERFAAIFDNSLDPMAIYDPNGILIRANRASAALLGYGTEMYGRSFATYVAPEYHSISEAAMERARAGVSSEVEEVLIAKDGRHILAITTVAPIVLHGDVVGVISSAKDMTEQRASEEQLLRSRERFRSLFEMHPSAVIAISPKGYILQVNVAMEELAGYTSEELVGRSPIDLLAPEEVEATKARFRSVAAGHPANYESAIVHKSGRRVEVEINAIPTLTGARMDGIYAIIKDVTRERALERRENTQRQRLRAVSQLAAAHATDVAHQIDQTLEFAVRSLDMDAVNVGVVNGDEMRVVHGAGRSYPDTYAFSLAQSFSRHVYGSHELLVIDDVEDKKWRDDTARAWQPWRQYMVMTLFIGGEAAGVMGFVAEQPRVDPFDEADRDFVRVVASLVGASLERERRERQLTDMAFIDSLTRLPNRAYFADQLARAIAGLGDRGGRIGVHYVDLDGFKDVNDQYGHAAGDDVLEIVARRLQAVIRDSDVLARIGGDEFVVLQAFCPDDEGALLLADRLIEAASEPLRVGALQVQLGASVGIARWPRDAGEPEELVHRADQAMYRAKRSGKSRSVLYEPEGDSAQE